MDALAADDCPWSCGYFSIVEAAWMNKKWFWSSGYGSQGLLSAIEREHLSKLGWDEYSWAACYCWKNNWGYNATDCVQTLYAGPEAECPGSQIRLWSQLSEVEQLAAVALGFTPTSWDLTSPYSCCVYEPLPLKGGVAYMEGAADRVTLLGSLQRPNSLNDLYYHLAIDPQGTKMAVGAENAVLIWDDLSISVLSGLR
eukprot:scaffold283235_cov48-Prasinocladus_malaysianus.AAC.1